MFAILCVGFMSRAYSVGELALNYVVPIIVVIPLIIANLMGFDSTISGLLPYKMQTQASFASKA